MFHLIREDIKRAFCKNRYRFIIVSFIIIALLLTFINRCNMMNSMTTEYGKLNFLDNIFCLLSGVEPITPDKMKETSFPYVWIAIQFICSFITMDYVYSDINGIGRDILIRSRSKLQWWISKCICNIVMVLMVYIIIVIASVAAAGMYSQVKGSIHIDLVRGICGLKNAYTYSAAIVLYLFVVPPIFSISISIVQMAITEFTEPVISLLCILSLDVISVFTNSKWLWGNWGMVTRSGLCIEDGISVMGALAASIIVGVVGGIVGGYIFCRKDVI